MTKTIWKTTTIPNWNNPQQPTGVPIGTPVFFSITSSLRLSFRCGEAAIPSPGEKVGRRKAARMWNAGDNLHCCIGIRPIEKLTIPRSLLVQHPIFLPAFHISHQNRFRSADFGDSFSPGEAKGAPAPQQPSISTINPNLGNKRPPGTPAALHINILCMAG